MRTCVFTKKRQGYKCCAYEGYNLEVGGFIYNRNSLTICRYMKVGCGNSCWLYYM
jgi:hypothetical protein